MRVSLPLLREQAGKTAREFKSLLLRQKRHTFLDGKACLFWEKRGVSGEASGTYTVLQPSDKNIFVLVNCIIHAVLL